MRVVMRVNRATLAQIDEREPLIYEYEDKCALIEYEIEAYAEDGIGHLEVDGEYRGAYSILGKPKQKWTLQ